MYFILHTFGRVLSSIAHRDQYSKCVIDDEAVVLHYPSPGYVEGNESPLAGAIDEEKTNYTSTTTHTSTQGQGDDKKYHVVR